MGSSPADATRDILPLYRPPPVALWTFAWIPLRLGILVVPNASSLKDFESLKREVKFSLQVEVLLLNMSLRLSTLLIPFIQLSQILASSALYTGACLTVRSWIVSCAEIVSRLASP